MIKVKNLFDYLLLAGLIWRCHEVGALPETDDASVAMWGLGRQGQARGACGTRTGARRPWSAGTGADEVRDKRDAWREG